MDRYKCHKEVQAIKIIEIEQDTDPNLFWIVGESKRPHLESVQVWVDLDWLAKHKPKVGGYFVQYSDGYRSYSPADAFEAGYTFIK